MRIVRFVVELLPRLVGAYERLLVRVASRGFHKPGFYLSTLFLAPIGLYWWRKPISRWWRRIPARILAYAAMVLAVRVFFAGFWIFIFLTALGRPIRFVWYKLGFDQSRRPPHVEHSLYFPLTRLDKAAFVFIAMVLLVFFVNRDQLMPDEDSDHNYHMAVAREIIDQGGLPRVDNWEYAPAGRPHLYPPALHMAIALFAGSPEKITQGFETLQVLVYPMGIFLTWWFARWLFGARMGLMTALVFSMDMMAGGTMLGVLPSAVVTAVMPLLFMCFLTRRKRASIILLTLCLYTHMGVPAMIVFGLFFFSVRYRGYYGFFKSVLTWSLVWYLPWFLRLLPEIAWLGMPSKMIAEAGGRTLGAYITGAIMGFLSLQMINVGLVVLGIWGLIRFRHPAARFLRCMLAGFLPMLILYGGRFQMHTAPIWAIFAASVVVRFLPQRATLRRIAVLAACTLVPLPALYIGMPGTLFAVKPTVGGGFFAFMYVLAPAKEDEDFQALAKFIEDNTKQNEIVHLDPQKDYLGDRIVTATGRRVDVGGWSAEVRNSNMAAVVEKYRRIDTDCLFVYENAEVPAGLACDRTEQIGRFNIGIRGKTTPLAEQTHPPEHPPAPI